MTNQIPCEYTSIRDDNKVMAESYGFNIDDLKGVEVRKVLRNCVVPEIGKYILNKLIKD
ncbi:MAG: hypothetical protein UT41_C0007G0008 [Candidatus Wolfebacteria bacterium GW2011_GWC2_39_22]|uniref:DNA (cytosine-5-)-methyltransferase n=1 Tax=Candidatus Wolfebacteria bacterium GW2011_GWC2_39_22 TaxID=1619013 RepID=A0A0G0QMW9_9BACT|nr:MAG: hypothetical protein UT41_C0007G0008 [Candidatus Wolfebacteria bacterium GW2011_GWC2_39_22]